MNASIFHALKNHHSKLIVILFFLSYLFLGFNLYPDYGISWDESVSRQNGAVNLKYIGEKYIPILLTENIKKSPTLHAYPDKDYGVAFEAPVVALEQLFNLEDTKDIFLFRHLATFLFSFLGSLAIYALVKKRYTDCSEQINCPK